MEKKKKAVVGSWDSFWLLLEVQDDRKSLEFPYLCKDGSYSCLFISP